MRHGRTFISTPFYSSGPPRVVSDSFTIEIEPTHAGGQVGTLAVETEDVEPTGEILMREEIYGREGLKETVEIFRDGNDVITKITPPGEETQERAATPYEILRLEAQEKANEARERLQQKIEDLQGTPVGDKVLALLDELGVLSL